MQDKLVSIIVPCYNHAEYLSETLDSVLSQTFVNWECIIVDDGSTDNSLEIIKSYCQRDNRFKSVSQENSGPAVARNSGIKTSSGYYILPLDADDKLREDYLLKAISYYNDFPETKLVYSNAYKFGALEGEWELLPYNYFTLLYRNMIYCTAMYKRVDYDNTKGYNSNMVYGYEDWDFWLSFLKEGDKVYCIPELCFYYRIKGISRDALLTPKIRQELLLRISENHKEIYQRYLPQLLNLMSADVDVKYKLNWEINYLKKELDKRINSKAYKLGKFLLNPFKK